MRFPKKKISLFLMILFLIFWLFSNSVIAMLLTFGSLIAMVYFAATEHYPERFRDDVVIKEYKLPSAAYNKTAEEILANPPEFPNLKKP
jgi:hypothetical protein